MVELLTHIDRGIGWLTKQVSNLFLVIIVLVVLYNVLMRYVFDAPPFWSDRIGVFANIGMILFGLSLTVRNRDLIAMQALYEKISPRFALSLDLTWSALILIFSMIFAWYGFEAAINMPGQYWDFQDFCIDIGLGDGEDRGALFAFFKSIEQVVGMGVRPFCVDGAVPQKYLAMLMPVSGVLLVVASLGVFVEDIKALRTLSAPSAAPRNGSPE